MRNARRRSWTYVRAYVALVVSRMQGLGCQEPVR